MDKINKYKFIAVVTILFLLPFLILSRHFMYGNRELVKRDTMMSMEMRTKTVANIAADLLAYNYDISAMLSPEFVRASNAVRKKLMEKKIKEKPSIYSEFSVLSAAGKEVVKTGTNSPKDLKDYSGTEVFRRAVSGPEHSGAVEYGEYTPPALMLIQPAVKKPGEKPRFFLLARMSLAYMGELVRFAGKNSSGNLGLIDAGGQLIADSLGRAIMNPGIKAPPEVLRTVDMAYEKRLNNLRTEVAFKGRSCLVSVTGISGTRWWIFEAVDSERAPDYRRASWAKRVIGIGILLMLIFGFMSYKLALLWLVPKQQLPVTGDR
ncbi:MAG: cache domain-containing protein [Elusimicrobia bacterium]|nr:cache domain-containing protein [Elusimicrobiota bacterium]